MRHQRWVNQWVSATGITHKDDPWRLCLCVWVCVLGDWGCRGAGGCGEVLSKQLSNPFFNDFGVGGGFVFFTHSLSSLTDYDNLYDHRFKWNRHTDRLEPDDMCDFARMSDKWKMYCMWWLVHHHLTGFSGCSHHYHRRRQSLVADDTLTDRLNWAFHRLQLVGLFFWAGVLLS